VRACELFEGRKEKKMAPASAGLWMSTARRAAHWRLIAARTDALRRRPTPTSRRRPSVIIRADVADVVAAAAAAAAAVP